MSKLECKYKFQNKEKFNGKQYCTCHNEICEDISFACDKNCQIYEDYKQLQHWKHQAELGSETCDRLNNETQKLKEENDGLKSEKDFLLQKIETVKAENEILKQHKRELGRVAQAFKKDIDSLKQEKLNIWRKLEKIRELCTSKYFYHVNGNTVIHTADILEIIEEK